MRSYVEEKEFPSVKHYNKLLRAGPISMLIGGCIGTAIKVYESGAEYFM